LYLTPLVAIGPISTDLYLPALPEMSHSLSATVSEVQITLSTFMIGFAVSQLLTGPLSDRYGRRPVIIGGMVLYFIASLVCAYAPNIEVLIAARFVQAFGSCTGSVLGRAIIRDVYEPKDSLRVLAVLGTAMAIAPALAPIVGSWLLEFFGWRSNFVTMAIFGAGLLGATLLTYQETNKYVGQSSLRPADIARNFGILLRNQTFRGYGLTMALMFGCFFSFLTGAPVVMINDMGLTPKEFGYGFSVMVIGFASGSAASGKLTQIYRPKTIVGVGASICLSAAFVMTALAWSDLQTPASLLITNSVVALGVGMTLPTCMASSIGPFPRLAGSAASLIGFCQGAFAASAGWLAGHFYDHSSRGLSSAILLFATAAILMYVFQARTAKDGVLD